MIHVIATIQLAAGTRGEFLKHFHALMPKVHAEAGCIEYGPTVDVAAGLPNQLGPRGDVVVVVEKWASLAALQAHLVAPHMTDYRVHVKPLVQSVELQVLEAA